MRSITLNVYRRDEAKLETFIDITNKHIDLIATAEQFREIASQNKTLFEITADGLSSVVTKNNVVSTINQSAEGISIKGEYIDLNGNTYANGNFKVSVDGSVEISGKVTADSGKIAGFSIVDGILRKFTDITVNNGVAQTQYAVLLRAPDGATATDNAIRVCHRTYSGTGTSSSSYSSWVDDFTVRYDGRVSGNNILISGGTMTGGTISGGNITGGTMSGGSAGGFAITTTSILKQMDSGTTRRELSLYAPANPSESTNAITVRHGTLVNGSVPNANWVYDFTVKYDGTVSSVSGVKEVRIHNGRFKVYRDSAWVGELAQGTYTADSYTTNAMYIQVGANIVTGFTTGATSDGTGTPILLYRPDLSYTYNGSTINGLWLFPRAIRLQEQPIINAGDITSISQMTSPKFRVSNAGYCAYGANTDHEYQMTYTTADAIAFYVDKAYFASLSRPSSDRRLKKKIKPIQNRILEEISKIEFKQFEFRKRDGKLHFGVIAQDVESAIGDVNSDIVFKDINMDGKDGKYLNLNYTEFLVLKMAALEKRVKELENERSRV